MKKLKILLTLIVAFNISIYAQQTVGLFQNSENSFDGYTLMGPLSSTTTYLLNNCGEVVHSWESDKRPGNSCYLLENGNLLRPVESFNTIFNGRWGGIIEQRSWENELLWQFTLSDDFVQQHHDIEYLPNGNILAIAWDRYTAEEAGLQGRVNSDKDIWSEKIVEIKPDYVNGGGTIVWEWKTWDHLVQDQNPSGLNYGNISESPQLVDINYLGILEESKADWLHFNGVDYNAELDQIAISVHSFSEFWIIDHSTTMEESAGHTGGKYGKGGDLLYRWGNPYAYKQGDTTDQILYLQHDAVWIKEGYVDEHKIMVFNNQAGRPQNLDYSAINVIETPINPDGSYNYQGGAYLPEQPSWTYTSNPPTDFYSAIISGASRLPNGNTLICEGTSGRLFEVDYEGNMVWEYVNPVGIQGAVPQYQVPTLNYVFKVERHAPDYPAFVGKDLSPKGHIETGTPYDCILYNNIQVENLKNDVVSAFPNPTTNYLTVTWNNDKVNRLRIYNSAGLNIFETSVTNNKTKVDFSGYSVGTYFIKLYTNKAEAGTKKVIVN